MYERLQLDKTRSIAVSRRSHRAMRLDARTFGNGFAVIKRSWWCLWIPRVVHVPIHRVVHFQGLHSDEALLAARQDGLHVDRFDESPGVPQ